LPTWMEKMKNNTSCCFLGVVVYEKNHRKNLCSSKLSDSFCFGFKFSSSVTLLREISFTEF
jgi:hypothetical protein